MDKLLKMILFDKVIMQEVTKHLTMKEIACLAGTCRIMHSTWINRKGVHLSRHLKQFFNWDTLSIGAFQTFRKRIFASLQRVGPCVGGCGNLNVVPYQCVPSSICKYVMCVNCFPKINVPQYMEKQGLLLANTVFSKHRELLIEKAQTLFSFVIVNDFFSSEDPIARLYNPVTISGMYASNERYMGYIRVTEAMIAERAMIHSATLEHDVRLYLEKKHSSAFLLVKQKEKELEDAKEQFNRRKRMYDEIGAASDTPSGANAPFGASPSPTAASIPSPGFAFIDP